MQRAAKTLKSHCWVLVSALPARYLWAKLKMRSML